MTSQNNNNQVDPVEDDASDVKDLDAVSQAGEGVAEAAYKEVEPGIFGKILLVARDAFQNVLSGKHYKKGMSRRQFIEAVKDHAIVAVSGSSLATQVGCQGPIEVVQAVVTGVIDGLGEALKDTGEEYDNIVRFLDILISKVPLLGDEEPIPGITVRKAKKTSPRGSTERLLAHAFARVKRKYKAQANRIIGNWPNNASTADKRLIRDYYTLLFTSKRVGHMYIRQRHKRRDQMRADKRTLRKSGKRIEDLEAQVELSEELLDAMSGDTVVDDIIGVAADKHLEHLADLLDDEIEEYNKALRGEKVDRMFEIEVHMAQTLSGLVHALKIAKDDIEDRIEELREADRENN